MSGNGRGTMRPVNKSPPFLVIGLFVALCILAFHYWSISSSNGVLSKKNGNLSNQLEALKLDFRTVSDKHISVEKRAADLSDQIADLQKKVNDLERNLEEKKTSLGTAIGNLEQAKAQSKQLQETLEDSKKNLEKCQEKSYANGLLEQPKQCDMKACSQPVHEVLSALVGPVKKDILAAALKNHVAIMDIAKQVLEGSDDGNKDKEQGQDQAPAQGQGGAPQADQGGAKPQEGAQPAAQEGAQPAAQEGAQPAPQNKVYDPSSNVIQMRQDGGGVGLDANAGARSQLLPANLPPQNQLPAQTGFQPHQAAQMGLPPNQALQMESRPDQAAQTGSQLNQVQIGVPPNQAAQGNLLDNLKPVEAPTGQFDSRERKDRMLGENPALMEQPPPGRDQTPASLSAERRVADNAAREEAEGQKEKDEMDQQAVLADHTEQNQDPLQDLGNGQEGRDARQEPWNRQEGRDRLQDLRDNQAGRDPLQDPGNNQEEKGILQDLQNPQAGKDPLQDLGNDGAPKFRNEQAGEKNLDNFAAPVLGEEALSNRDQDMDPEDKAEGAAGLRRKDQDMDLNDMQRLEQEQRLQDSDFDVNRDRNAVQGKR